MCEWCEDLRNVQPAKYIDFSDGEPDWLLEAKKKKMFLAIKKEEDGSTVFYQVFHCPKCGKVFENNTKLYDSYI